MRVALFVLFTIVFNFVTTANAQQDVRIPHLVSKILEKLPDAAYTRQALGTTDEREVRATEHAVFIVSAADQYSQEWEDFVEEAGWTEFKPKRDLPALIAAVAFHESSFRSVIRLDDNTIVKKIPKNGRADMGVMQVRAPSEIATNCGVTTKTDVQRLVDDLEFAYKTGACVLTKRIAAYINRYRSQAFKRLMRSERPDLELRYYGAYGPRRNTVLAKRARELLVLERYNWGDADLYLHPLHGGYARRISTLFEFFRLPDPEETT